MSCARSASHRSSCHEPPAPPPRADLRAAASPAADPHLPNAGSADPPEGLPAVLPQPSGRTPLALALPPRLPKVEWRTPAPPAVVSFTLADLRKARP